MAMIEAKERQAIIDSVCEAIADGRSVKSICKGEGFPNEATIYRWLDTDEDFRKRYARAKEVQADALFEECLEIADQYEKALEHAEGGIDHIQRAKLRIDTRKWMAGKLRPKKYGEKIGLSGDGEGGAIVLQVVKYADDSAP